MKYVLSFCVVLFSTVSACMENDGQEGVESFSKLQESARSRKDLKLVWELERCKEIIDAQNEDALIAAYARAAHMGSVFIWIGKYFQLACSGTEEYLTNLISQLQISDETKKTEVSTKFWKIHKENDHLAMMFKLPQQKRDE